MDEAVKKLILTLSMGVSLVHLPAAAQALQDPTRPPAGLHRVAPDAAAAGGPRLQSILIAPHAGGRHVAVIDGDTVRLGERWKGARVASMTHSEVVLVRGAERQVLRLDGPLATVAGTSPAGRAVVR
jgi:MSHA biogenesis protein MshK